VIFDPKWRIEDRKEDKVITFPRFLAIMLILAAAAALMVFYSPKSHARESKGSAATYHQVSPRIAVLNIK
jgi:hypothetical protein